MEGRERGNIWAAHQELHNVTRAALLEDSNLAQEADVVPGIVLLQLLHSHGLDVPPLCPVHLHISMRSMSATRQPAKNGVSSN